MSIYADNVELARGGQSPKESKEQFTSSVSPDDFMLTDLGALVQINKISFVWVHHDSSSPSLYRHKKEKKRDKERDRDRKSDKERSREERERSTSKKKKSKDKERERERKSDGEKGDVKVGIVCFDTP